MNNAKIAHENAVAQAESTLQEIQNRIFPLKFLSSPDWSDVAEMNRLNADLANILTYLADVEE